MERNLNFDEIIPRRHTDSLKFDFVKKRGRPDDVLPLWVADMDFKTSSYVQDAIDERTRHGIFGYSDTEDDNGEYFKAVHNWILTRHGFNVKSEWLIKTPGVVNALAMAVKAFTSKGDNVLIQQPVYYPFSEVIRDNGRSIVSNNLYIGSDRLYHIDFEDFEAKIVKNDIRLFLLCSPHNPVGRVWTKDELTRLGDICVKRGVKVVSDEIHADFVFAGQHTPFASIKPEFEDISVTCTSASKTFNLASMLLSNIFIPNAHMRKAFQKQLDAAGISQLSALSLVAYTAAYKDGGEWYEAVKKYIGDNINYLHGFISERLPEIRCFPTEGTYLCWLDFRGLGLSCAEIERKIVYESKLWLDSGSIFGACGEGFQRINVACPRSVLKEAMERLEKKFGK